jgi:hypothetical protein
MGTGIALILAQYFVTALQLWGSNVGRSSSLPRLSGIRVPPSEARSMLHALGAMAVLSCVPFLVDLAATISLLRCIAAWLAAKLTGRQPPPWRISEFYIRHDKEDMRELHADSKAVPQSLWMASYARRRLGIAGLLQALPQAFFHCYMLLYCYTRDGCARHQPPSRALLGAAVGLDVAVIAVSAPAIFEVWDLVTHWLTWGNLGALLREVVDSGLYIADIGSDIYFVIVSTSPLPVSTVQLAARHPKHPMVVSVGADFVLAC